MADPVMLTGATGFVGRAILAELRFRGIPVHAVSRHPGPAQTGVIWHRADLLRKEDRARVAGLAPLLIHAAWEVPHGSFWTAPSNTAWQAASLDLIRRFCAAGGTRVLALGTCAEYDAQIAGPWNEDRLIAPSTPYGQAKAELHCDLAAVCGTGLVWARLFHLYGPGEDRRRLVPSLIDAIRQGQPAEVRASGLIRDFASTAHVAHCIVTLLLSGATGAFDIGSGAARSLGALAQIIAGELSAPDLLRLSSPAQAAETAIMAPELHRLRAAIGPCDERPETALAAHVRADREAIPSV
ncbi:NAD(P)-dependent oxidoreductase [Gemmobacter sp. LW-1]|uniref:NAD-dependent epimerase/dehydratase family protein n=1 Tax=Gemmobacter sp. LW-1 TaxID=1529005 RepID=UPI0006C752A1|nr:NAD-dependent epimerase/dehydratase family protein [Gemmobacter sp. LW-1]